MKHPGQPGRQEIDIESITVNPEWTLREAIRLAASLGAEPAYEEDEYVEIDDGFVEHAIDFRTGDAFYITPEATETEQADFVFEVTSTAPLEVRHALADTDSPEHNPIRWTKLDSHEALWLEWVRGNVVRALETTTYYREDTGEAVN
ncbi:hypothetical protein [Halosegnis longus]|uniref:hypothetical protein n=1 Tax=Halosegnis longus TaxID=2216012 RepID=UPI00129E16DD|nr:hypothetical protein [Halosegnis longus]